MAKILVVALCFTLAAGAFATADVTYAPPHGYPSILAITKGGGCAPKDNTARILNSPHPLDYVANWSGTKYVGAALTFMPKRYAITELAGGIFLQGDLIDDHGSITDRNVFILYVEWDCAFRA